MALFSRAATRTVVQPPSPWLWAGLAAMLGGALVLDRLVARLASGPGVAPARGAPTKLSPSDWRRVFVSAARESQEDQLPTVAAGVTFYMVLALFPATAAFVSLYGLFFEVQAASRQLAVLAGVLPRGMVTFIGDEMLRLAGADHGGLSVGFAVGLAFSLWSANAGMKAIFAALNVAYEVREDRGFVRLTATSLGFTVAAIGLVGAAFAAASFLPQLFARTLDPGAARLLTWPLLAAVMLLSLSVLYRYGPARGKVAWRWVTPGGVVSTVIWLGASAGFSWYLASFAHYEKTYGSLGAVIGLMMWLWITVTVILFGAELNLEVEHRAAGRPRA